MGQLAQLLGHDHPLFAYNLALLERATGQAGIDTRLIADITESVHGVMRQLNLNPADTRALELYKALESVAAAGRAPEMLEGSQYLIALIGGETISLNVEDVLENYQNKNDFADRVSNRGTWQLRAEIVRRYADHDRTDNKLVHILAEQAGIVGPDNIENTESNKEKDMQDDNTGNVPNILCIGDIISDDFIDMTMSHIKVSKDDEGYEWAAMELGGKIPYDNATRVDAVECSPNAAVSMSRLGLDVSLMSWIGDDSIGGDMITYLKGENVNTDSMVVEAGKKSNFHYVLRYGADRTKLQKFEDYSYQWQEPTNKPDWLYLGVLGDNTWPLHESIMEYLEANPETKLAFQPGMHHLAWGAEKLAKFYKHANIVILNREEAAQVTGKDRGDINVLLESMHELGVNTAVVTDGPAGAYASDGTESLFMPNYPDIAPPYDRTGAGDAFASTIVAALARGKSLTEALMWAPINSMNVVQKLGAQAGLQTEAEIKSWLEKAPDDYHVKAIE